MKCLNFFGSRITCTDQKTLLLDVENLGRKQEANYITFTNVHVVITAMKNEALRVALNASSRVAPDGMPLVWAGKLFCKSEIERCSGPDMMAELLRASEGKGLSHFFYGSTDETLNRLHLKIKEKYPDLVIKGMYAPPFRPMTSEEDKEVIKMINTMKPDYLWVGLGAPRQEIWMYEHKPYLHCGVQLGVGAAFDFLSESKKRAPVWMQKTGFEWLYRFLQEPRRLGKRYLVTNFLFLIKLISKGVKAEEIE